MKRLLVEAKERKLSGKNANRRLRQDGRIPGVVYGKGRQSFSVSIDSAEVYRILHSEAGRNTIFKLEMGGWLSDVLIRDYQLDPVKEDLVHADFQVVSMDQKMAFQVPIEAVGLSKGVKAGGILDIVLREVELLCLPSDVPDHIRVDVTDLEVGDIVRLEKVEVDVSKVTILSDSNLVVVTVVPPPVEEEPEIDEVEEAAEPEVIKREAAEEEEETAV